MGSDKEIVCYNNSNGAQKGLTVGKTYQVISENAEYYRIIDDDGVQNGYAKERFIIKE